MARVPEFTSISFRPPPLIQAWWAPPSSERGLESPIIQGMSRILACMLLKRCTQEGNT